MVQAAGWVRAHTTSDMQVLTNSPYVLFYSNRFGVTIRHASQPTPKLMAAIEKRRYAVAVVESYDLWDDVMWVQSLAKTYADIAVPGVTGGSRNVRLFAAEPQRLGISPLSTGGKSR